MILSNYKLLVNPLFITTMCMYLHSCVQSDSNSHKHLQVCSHSMYNSSTHGVPWEVHSLGILAV